MTYLVSWVTAANLMLSLRLMGPNLVMTQNIIKKIKTRQMKSAASTTVKYLVGHLMSNLNVANVFNSFNGTDTVFGKSSNGDEFE